MALVGEELDEKDEVCGAVVSLRAKIDRIQLWTRGKDDIEAINNLGRKLIKLLDVSDEPGVGLEFQVSGLILAKSPHLTRIFSIIRKTGLHPTSLFPSRLETLRDTDHRR